MAILSIDIETYSDADLSKCGVYAYSDSPNFEILLFAYAFDEEPTQIVDLACGERLPERVLTALEDPAITKAAFNAQFERTCISKYLGRRLSSSGWQCTAVQSAMLALPLSLDSVGEVLNIQRKKLKEGADLVRFFSMPCKPTKANGGRTRNRPRMRRKNGNGLKPIVSGMWMRSERSGRGCGSFPSRNRRWNCTGWIRRSMIGAFWWISSWWRMQSFVITSTGRWSRPELMN